MIFGLTASIIPPCRKKATRAGMQSHSASVYLPGNLSNHPVQIVGGDHSHPFRLESLGVSALRSRECDFSVRLPTAGWIVRIKR
jgi:hypothetical protein